MYYCMSVHIAKPQITKAYTLKTTNKWGSHSAKFLWAAEIILLLGDPSTVYVVLGNIEGFSAPMADGHNLDTAGRPNESRTVRGGIGLIVGSDAVCNGIRQ